MSLLGLASTYAGPESALLLWLLYEFYFPEWLHPGGGTKFHQVKKEVKGDVENVRELLLQNVTVTRALVRTDEDIDTDKVDDYLEKNGVEPEDFIDNTSSPPAHGFGD